MENQEITTKEDQITARTLNNGWIARTYTIGTAGEEQPAIVTEEHEKRQAPARFRTKTWIPVRRVSAL